MTVDDKKQKPARSPYGLPGILLIALIAFMFLIYLVYCGLSFMQGQKMLKSQNVMLENQEDSFIQGQKALEKQENQHDEFIAILEDLREQHRSQSPPMLVQNNYTNELLESIDQTLDRMLIVDKNKAALQENVNETWLHLLHVQKDLAVHEMCDPYVPGEMCRLSFVINETSTYEGATSYCAGRGMRLPCPSNTAHLNEILTYVSDNTLTWDNIASSKERLLNIKSMASGCVREAETSHGFTRQHRVPLVTSTHT